MIKDYSSIKEVVEELRNVTSSMLCADFSDDLSDEQTQYYLAAHDFINLAIRQLHLCHLKDKETS